jgi:hypothetical protein
LGSSNGSASSLRAREFLVASAACDANLLPNHHQATRAEEQGGTNDHHGGRLGRRLECLAGLHYLFRKKPWYHEGDPSLARARAGPTNVSRQAERARDQRTKSTRSRLRIILARARVHRRDRTSSATTIARRPADSDYLSACTKKLTDCPGADIDDYCASTILSDAWLVEAQGCLTKSCTEAGPCLRAIFKP